ncbi:hypothetical protein HYPSUDRAFT_149860, partial [Hypholoma sublateritium FD-334 SS-4]
LEHIMIECEASGQKQIWRLATETLAQRNIDITTLSIGEIMGCAMPQYKNSDKKPDTALDRLYTIIMTESMYLIWLIQCEWVLDHGGDQEKINSDSQITARWKQRINRRIRLDQTMATKRAHKWKKVDKKLVLETWRGTLENEENLPEDWIRMRGVLVGTGVDRPPPGRNR